VRTVVDTYKDNMKLVWRMALDIAGLSFLAAFQREVDLRMDLKNGV